MAKRAQLKNRLQEHDERQPSGEGKYAQACSSAENAMHRTGEMIGDHPGVSSLTTFAVGCFLGMLTVWALTPERKRTVHWRDWSGVGNEAGEKIAQFAREIPRAARNYARQWA